MITRTLKDWANLAVQSLQEELDLTPKPGLVDRDNAGAHQDMDYSTFQASISALKPFFYEYLQIGYQYHHLAPSAIFSKLRSKGLEAEYAMFQATKGINTHKGINFLMAVLLGSCGHYLANQPHILESGLLIENIHAICLGTVPLTQDLEAQDLVSLHTKKIQDLSHGERLYLQYGIKGPRGMVMSGFDLIRTQALPYYQQLLITLPSSIAQMRLLLFLMSKVEDGNLIHRGGIHAWKQVQAEADALSLIQEDQSLIQALTRYNQELIDRHLSPGGSADLLSICFFLNALSNYRPSG